MKVDASGEATLARIRVASLATDLRAENRLRNKIDMSAGAIAARIQAASDLLTLCLDLGAIRQRGAGSQTR